MIGLDCLSFFFFLKCSTIYIPVGGSQRGFLRQLLASMLCFSFVFFWHGVEVYLLYWALINWLGVVVEITVQKAVEQFGILAFLVSVSKPSCLDSLNGPAIFFSFLFLKIYLMLKLVNFLKLYKFRFLFYFNLTLFILVFNSIFIFLISCFFIIVFPLMFCLVLL